MRLLYFISAFALIATSVSAALDVKHVIDVAAQQYEKVVHQIKLGHDYPIEGVMNSDHWRSSENDWANGFFPGVLWQLYNHTKNDVWKERAIVATKGLAKEQFNDYNHDVGFQIMCSFGEGYALTGDHTYPDIIVNAAKHLASRFNKQVGCLRSWGGLHETKNFLVIVDNMMNLELLMKAYELSKNIIFVDIAVSHANRTAAEHLRADFSSFHVVNFNQTDGQVIHKYTAQGYSDGSCWSRGQAWLVTGYTQLYGHTKIPHHLSTAEHVAKYFIDHLPEDGIPVWDFNAPHDPVHHPYVPRDVSAGAIASVGLFELYGHTHKQRYLDIAHKIVQSLGSPKYLATGHSEYHLPSLLANSTISHADKHPELADRALIYADYYYLKALGYLHQYPIKN